MSLQGATTLAAAYRERRHGAPPATNLLTKRASETRTSRAAALLEIIAAVATLDTGRSDNVSAPIRSEGWATLGLSTDVDSTEPSTRLQHRSAWRAAAFDLMVRDRLTLGQWCSSLRLGEHQTVSVRVAERRTHLEVSGPRADPDATDRSLRELSVIRDMAASATSIEIIPQGGEHTLGRRVRAALGAEPGSVPDEHDALGSAVATGTSPPVIIVSVAGAHVIGATRIDPWLAIASPQRERETRDDAISTGVLMMVAGAGFMPVPAAAIGRSTRDEVIGRQFQERRLATVLAHTAALAADKVVDASSTNS